MKNGRSTREGDVDRVLERLRLAARMNLGTFEPSVGELVVSVLGAGGSRGSPELRELIGHLVDHQREAFNAGARSILEALISCVANTSSEPVRSFFKVFLNASEETLKESEQEWRGGVAKATERPS